ncbi:unnamed protein product [Adineta steineri]|uniref:G-protein coupled receptors family 1 profile domain-containing protein n=4 Tax=Adineta steineri TaxID=433720 RepID=A0A818Z4L9_9BILA|nr:unnamed protein product [Adineta steineri]CAF3761996.1 unnamed protein product [Adineta steineri]
MVDNVTINYTNSYDDEYGDGNEVFIPSAQIQFWTYLILGIPSLFCTIFLLYHLIFDRRLRQQIHNHVVIVLLFLCLVILAVDNSLYLDGWRVGHGNSIASTPTICLLWWFIDYGFYGAISVFLVWASFERHILVFHRRQFLSTKRKIFYVHYLPLIIISIYTIGFYIGVIILPPCKNIFYFNYLACGSLPCYQEISWMNTWDYLFNGVLCNIFEAIFSISLLLRTIWKKYYSQNRFRWKKYRKMTIQLLSISTLSLCIHLPQSLIILVRQIQPNRNDFGTNIEPYFFYLTGYVIFLVPFVSLGCLPELWPKLLLFNQRHHCMIGPMTMTAAAATEQTILRSKDG